MKIGIFGGTFDPIHKGHTSLCKDLTERGIVDKIIITVTYITPLKERKITESNHRFNMAKLVESENFSVSDYEIIQGGKSYTFNTLEHFSALYPEDDIYFILGADMFLDLPNWYNAEELMEKYRFIVIDRENSLKNMTKKPENYPYNAKAIFADIKTPDISSTVIREKLANKLDVSEFLDERVLNYIKEYKLYD